MTMRVHRGYSAEFVQAARQVRLGEGVAGLAAVEQRPVVVSIADYPSPRLAPYFVREGFQTIVSTPLISKGQLLGALSLSSRRPRDFSPEERELLAVIGQLLGGAVENARLYEAAHQQRQETETLREAALALTTSLERNEVVERILGQLQRMVPYDSASVQLLRGDRLEIIGGRGFPNLSELLGVSFPVEGNNPNREVVHSRAPFIVADAPAKYPGFTQDPHAPARIHSWLGVPMLVGERLIGMIALDKREPGFYGERHARIAQAFATQAAIAIENARLYEKERRRAAQLATVNEVGRHAISTLQLDEILRDVALAIQMGFHYYNVDVFLVEGEDAVLKALSGGFAEIAKMGYRQALSQGIIGWTITHNQTVLANDITQDPRYIPGWQKDEMLTKSELCVPIHIENQVLGALDVQSIELNAFDQSDVMALEILADQIALAGKNALAYGRLDQEKARLELLYEVAAEVNSTLNLDEILARAVASITTRLGGQVGYLFLVEPGSDRLRAGAVSGINVSLSDLNESMDARMGQGLLGWVIAHRQAAVVGDVTQDKRWLYVDELDRSIRSVMSAPLLRGEEVLGAVSIMHPTPGFFGEDQGRLLTAIAQQVSVAIANARLHEAIREQSLLDSLTQVYNHGELIKRLHAAVAEATANHTPVSYIMLDIDHFKAYNDRYGHVTGDLVLNAIVQAIRANIKKVDAVGRWGGEEFGIVLPNTDVTRARVVTERIRHTLATMPLMDKTGQAAIKPTVSQGIAVFPANADCADGLIDLADVALYQAKAKGRDQIVISEARA